MLTTYFLVEFENLHGTNVSLPGVFIQGLEMM